MPTENNASRSRRTRARASNSRRRSSIDEVMARADIEAQLHHEQQQQQQADNANGGGDDTSSSVMRLESDNWCNVDEGGGSAIVDCIIHAIPICEAVETMVINPRPRLTSWSSSYGGSHDNGAEDCSIFTAPSLQSLSRSFGAMSFDSSSDDANVATSSASSHSGSEDDRNHVVSTADAADHVILEMDEEGAIESSILATATAKSIFVDIGQYLYNHNSNHCDLATAISTDIVSTTTTGSTTTTTTTTTATATETSIHPCMARAEFVSATFIKKTPDDFVGITLTTGSTGGTSDQDQQPENNKQDGDKSATIRIAAIHPNGILYQNSPLRVGDQLLSISGQSCFELDNTTTATTTNNKNNTAAAAGRRRAPAPHIAAQELLDQAPAGIVSLVARNPTGSVQYVETMVEKPFPTAPVGIAMTSSEYGSILISNIVASGLFAHSLLNVGDRVISINHEYCPQGLAVQVAIDMIRDSPRFVCILTETQSRAGVVVPSAEVGLQGTVVIPTTEEAQQERPLSAAARMNWRRRYALCIVILSLMIVVVLVDLLVIHPI
jgi:hypothetical protein